jgi:hypothetical protein
VFDELVAVSVSMAVGVVLIALAFRLSRSSSITRPDGVLAAALAESRPIGDAPGWTSDASERQPAQGRLEDELAGEITALRRSLHEPPEAKPTVGTRARA